MNRFWRLRVKRACSTAQFANGTILKKRSGPTKSTVSRSLLVAMATMAIIATTDVSRGAEFMVRNGMILDGRMGKLSGIAETPLAAESGETAVTPILLVDDGLRRTYVSTYQMLPDVRESDLSARQSIRIKQRVAKGVKGVASIQSILNVEPFDDWGRRTFSIMTPRGRMDIVQGITEITPLYVRVEGLVAEQFSIQWDSRIATSSIPRETLSRILRNRAESNTADGRLEVVRLLFASERYRDAREELELAIKEFPELEEVKHLLEELKQNSTQRLIAEIRKRSQSGQHRYVLAMLEHFPTKGIAGEHLEEIREINSEYQKEKEQAEKVVDRIKKYGDAITDPVLRPQVESLAKEIESELNINNVGRLADFARLADDETMTDAQKLSLAFSGWLMGSGASIDNLAVATSLHRVRDLVVEYLRSTNDGDREKILRLIEEQEGGIPSNIAKIAANIKPPLLTTAEQEKLPGQFEIAIPQNGGSDQIVYDVQLPLEYDPYRRYPAIVTLHGAGRTAAQQIDWWCGTFDDRAKVRTGQATRHGYIVIAPRWATPTQRAFEYSFREHQAVLASLRDAQRRFSIDTDRVFLSGLSMGGDAAWDIALSHPDIWAGVLPIVATSDHGRNAPKYVSRYAEHAKYVPQYFVMGEKDGDRLQLNATNLDRYLTRAGYDTMVVEYIGRGHEHYYDEIHRLFEWMNLHKRTPTLESFKCSTLRPWDNFFWCVEIDQLPERAMVDPLDWPTRSARPAETKFQSLQNNVLTISTAAGKLTAWLSPEWVDFNRAATISVNGRRKNYELAGSNRDLLEDLRTRSDRLHPYWMKLELTTGRRR